MRLPERVVDVLAALDAHAGSVPVVLVALLVALLLLPGALAGVLAAVLLVAALCAAFVLVRGWPDTWWPLRWAS